MLLFGPSGRVLLLRASLATRPEFWVCPGGGVEGGESWEEAAHREVMEEAGLSVRLGAFIWYRRHVYTDGGRDYDLYERYYVGHTASEEVRPGRQDGYVRGHRWWAVDELLAADAEFAPRRLKELVRPIARGEYPQVPFDCGV